MDSTVAGVCSGQRGQDRAASIVFRDATQAILPTLPRLNYRCATKIDFGITPWMPLVPSTTWVT